MKALTVLLLLVFSIPSFSQTYTPQGTDFAPFPLSTANVALLEGVWRGEAIDIEIENSSFNFGGKPVLWVKIQNHEEDNSRNGIMYFNEMTERYQLFTRKSHRSIPISFGVFEFSSSYAAKEGIGCPLGGALLKIEFKIDSILGEVLLTKESCS